VFLKGAGARKSRLVLSEEDFPTPDVDRVASDALYLYSVTASVWLYLPNPPLAQFVDLR
jgi:hypothetical protein